MTSENRRENESTSDKELYQLSKGAIGDFIEKERRQDELDRLREVQGQKNTWFKTVVFCGLLNLILVCLAIVGMMK